MRKLLTTNRRFFARNLYFQYDNTWDKTRGATGLNIVLSYDIITKDL